MAIVSGPSPFLGRADNKWAYSGDSSGYSPPESPDAAPEPYMPGPVSSLLDYTDFKAIAKHSSGYVPQGPTTSWADVVDQSVRDQQRRERGIPNQPTPGKKPALPGQEQQDQQQADPEQAQREMLRQQNEAKIQATRAKLQQAQRLRQAAEQQQAGAQEKVSATKLDVDRASQQLKNAQDDLDDKPDDPDLQDEVDRWQQALKEAQAANDDARAKEADAAAQVEEATRGEDTANKELQQLEADQAQQDQQAQQADQEAQAKQDQAQQGDQAAADGQPTEGPYGQAAATDQANPEQGQAQPFGPPSAEPGQPGQPDQGQADQQDPVQRAIAQVKAQGGNADNLLDAIAAEAWKQESGRAAPNWMDPNDVKAYDNYRASWVGAFRAGQDVPLAGNLRAAAGGQSAPAQQNTPAQQASYDPNQPVSPSNQPPANPNLIGGPGQPPLAGPGAGPQPAAGATPGVGTNPVGPAGSALPGAPGAAQTTPAAPPSSGPQLDQANQTLAAAQARDAQLQKQLEQATSAADAAQKKMEAAQEAAGKLSKEMASGVGSSEYRQYSLGPALNKAQGDVSAAAQQLAQARARATQTQQMLATSQQSIAAAQNLVKLASVQPPSAGPAAAVARDAGDAAQAGQLLNTMLAKATPEQQQRIIADINTGGPAGTEVLRQIATQAWYKQLAAQGQPTPAGGPPKDYIESWMGMYRAGQTGAPLIAALKAELAKRGAVAQSRGGALDPRDAGVVPPPQGNGPISSALQQTTGTTPPAAPAPAPGPTGSVLVPPSPDGSQAANGGPAAANLTGPAGETLYFTGNGYYSDGKGKTYQKKPDGTLVLVEDYSQPKGATPAGTAITPADNPDSSSPGGPMYGPMNDAQPSGYDAYIKAMRELGDTRSDSELAAEFRKNTTTYPSQPQDATRTSLTNAPMPTDVEAVKFSNPSPVTPKLENPPPVTPASTYPQQLPVEQRRLWDEWRAAGGSGDWGDFTRHAVAVGAPDMSGAGAPPAVSARGIPPTSQAPIKPPFDPSAPAPLLNGVPITKIDPIAVTARVAGVTDEQGQMNIAHAIGAWLKGDPSGQWAQDHVENTARLGWAAQTGGRPEDAPADYVAKWVNDFKGGETSSPMQEQLNQALRARGLFAPADGKMGWNPALGARIAQENFWGANPVRQAAMVEFSKLPWETRVQIFENSMDAGLTAEGITDPGQRENWKKAMWAMTQGGPGWPGENGDLNPYVLAGESGGRPSNGHPLSSAIGYFQFISQTRAGPGTDEYGHWRNYSPYPNDPSQMTNPVTQVRMYIRSVNQGSAHGDPWGYVRQKQTGDHTWGP